MICNFLFFFSKNQCNTSIHYLALFFFFAEANNNWIELQRIIELTLSYICHILQRQSQVAVGAGAETERVWRNRGGASRWATGRCRAGHSRQGRGGAGAEPELRLAGRPRRWVDPGCSDARGPRGTSGGRGWTAHCWSARLRGGGAAAGAGRLECVVPVRGRRRGGRG
jgi:hypothetical protein